MLMTVPTRKPACLLARAGVRVRLCVRPDAFGNALGQSFVGAMQPTQGVGPYSASGYTNEMDRASDSYRPIIDYADVEAQLASGYQIASGAGGRSMSTDNAPIDSFGRVYGPQYGREDGWYTTSEGVLQRATQNSDGVTTITGKREATTGSETLDDGLINMTGGLLTGASVIHGAAQFASDQFWTLGNVFTGGWLSNNNSVAHDAVARNTALGRSIVGMPQQLSGLALRTVTGNWRGMDPLNSNQINALNAQGDRLGAKVLAGQAALNVAGLATGVGALARGGVTMYRVAQSENQAASAAAAFRRQTIIENNFGADSGYRPHEISIFGMPGAVGRGVEAFSHPYYYTGHVGFSFNNGNSIYGLGPHAPGMPIPELIQSLKDGAAYPGYVTNDRVFFKEALNSQATTRYGIGKELGIERQTVYKLDMPVTRGEFEMAQRLTLQRGLETPLPEFPYSFKTGGACVAPFNCATYPSSLGLPIPANTGAVSRYVPEMIRQGATPWRPSRQ